jgi:hypothetical protein
LSSSLADRFTDFSDRFANEVVGRSESAEVTHGPTSLS